LKQNLNLDAKKSAFCVVFISLKICYNIINKIKYYGLKTLWLRLAKILKNAETKDILQDNLLSKLADTLKFNYKNLNPTIV